METAAREKPYPPRFFCCVRPPTSYFHPPFITNPEPIALNTDLCKQALAKVGNPNILVNLISRRVRQLNTGGAAGSRPLLSETATLGAADIALLELIEQKMGWESQGSLEAEEAPGKRRKRA